MKTILSIFLLCLPVQSAIVPLIWDHSHPQSLSYAVWAREAGTQAWQWHFSTSGNTFDYEGLAPGVWEFRVTGIMTSGVHTEPTDPLTVVIPEDQQGPANLRMRVAVQASDDMKDWKTVAVTYTGDMDRKFFRVAFEP